MRLLCFSAEWCAPCTTQHEILDELAEDVSIEIEHIDVDENQQMANDYSVRGIPFMVLEDEDENIVASVQGLTDKSTLEQLVNGA